MDSSRGESTTLLDTPLGDYLAFSTLPKAFRCMIMFNVIKFLNEGMFLSLPQLKIGSVFESSGI